MKNGNSLPAATAGMAAGGGGAAAPPRHGNYKMPDATPVNPLSRLGQLPFPLVYPPFPLGYLYIPLGTRVPGGTTPPSRLAKKWTAACSSSVESPALPVAVPLKILCMVRNQL